jgi:hypothetical protein
MDVPVYLRVLLAGFLVAHALVHAAFLAPRPPAVAGGPPWPFELDRSRMLRTLGVGGEAARRLGMSLLVPALGGFVLASAAALGIGPAVLWPAAIGVGALGSLALLVTFFHPWLVLGVAIDLAMLAGVLLVGWPPGGFAGR